MTGKYILDESGEPVPAADLLAWGRWYETADRGVARDRVGGAEVSTVFLGLDHNFGSGPPVLYETMVFGGPSDGLTDRYATRAEAVAGHARMMEQLRAAGEGI